MTSSLIRTEFFVAALVIATARGGCGPPPSPAPSPSPAPQPAVVKRGVEVGWISREPRLVAPETVDAPAEAGWPEDGRIVHWIAHVINRTGAPLPAVPYVWRIGGETLGGVVDLPPGRTEVLLARRWTFAREQIAFAVTPPPEAADASTGDNQVTALTFVDADGAPVADPEVDVYLDQHGHVYHKAYTAEPTRALARAPGRGALLPGDILEGMPPAGFPAKSQVIILRVRTPQARGYAFLPVYYLNLLHFEGHHDLAALEISVVMHRW